jgi:orotate phosphoribosyltransferase-like protein
MGKLKELVTTIVEMYDEQGLSVSEIANKLDMSQEEVSQVVAEWSISYSDEGPEYDDSMDGDWDSGMASAGFGTDEDYGSFGDNEW